MNTFVCKVCGYVAFDQAPDNCPVCHAPKTSFQADANAIKKPTDPNNLNELEKKHIPAISIKRQCGMVGSGCVDVNIKIGEIMHVMEPKHYIMYIAVYLEHQFIGRYHLVPERLNPALGMHLKATSGKLLVLENCNIHGRWVSEAEI